MRRLLLAVAILAGITWGVLCWRVSRAPDGERNAQVRTAALVVMIAAGSMIPTRRQNEEDTTEEF